MSALSAAYEVLKGAGEPLHCSEIAKRVLDASLWQTTGKTPEATIHAQLAMSVKRKGADSPFQRTAKATFGLREWGLAEHVVSEKGKESAEPTAVEKGSPKAKTPKTMSFTDAAEHVLEKHGGKQPMHYRQITEKALGLGLVSTAGKTPEASLYASVTMEINRYKKRGETPRFVMHGRGYIGLSRWMSLGLAFQIDQHNRAVRKKLHAQIRGMAPGAFEELIGELLASLGFEEVAVTERSADGGIDVRGTLVVGDVIRTRMAVQVKRWKPNVQKPVVQQVRGSLGAHEQGLIVTTSGFSKGARDEAERADAVPVGLMDGDQLVRLLLENDIGVTRRSHDVFELKEGDASPIP